MYRVHNITQAYSQAPWRKQLQWVGLFMLAMILVAMVAGIYLSVSAQASSAGREIQIMYSEMDEIRRNIEDMESQFAFMVSNTEMEKRAQEMGFTKVPAEDIFYIVVPGYVEPDQVDLAGSPGATFPSVATVAPEYTQSLFDWLEERVFDPASPLVQEVKP
jgi:cell division protein FtsL